MPFRVTLKKRARTLKNGKRVEDWTLRWKGLDGREFSESIGKVGEITRHGRRPSDARRRQRSSLGRPPATARSPSLSRSSSNETSPNSPGCVPFGPSRGSESPARS